MNKQDIIKNILIIVAVLAVIFFAYKFLIPAKEEEGVVAGSPSQGAGVITSTKSEVVSVRDIEFLSKKLEGIKVDTGIFLEKGFSSLEDYRTVVPKEPIGRDNPFSEI